MDPKLKARLLAPAKCHEYIPLLRLLNESIISPPIKLLPKSNIYNATKLDIRNTHPVVWAEGPNHILACNDRECVLMFESGDENSVLKDCVARHLHSLI